MEFCVGMVVRSRAGRDAGRWCVIVGLEDGYARIADGDLRRLAAPKRKKLRHLAATHTVLKLSDHPTDKSLRQALAAFGQPAAADQGGQELVQRRCH